MIKEDNYEKVFSNKINGNNIEIIKKFFVFPSNKKNHTQKPYTSLSAAKRVSKLP
jgi:site-specific recombinase XerD